MKGLIDVLREHNVPIKTAGEHPNVREGWIGIECPWCGPGGKRGGFYLGLNLSSLSASCWKCGPHKLSAVLSRLGIRASLLRNLRSDTPRPLQTHIGRYTPPVGVGPLMPQHCKYLMGRGFDPTEIVKLWEIGGIGIAAGGLSWRVYIPAMMGGRPMTWTARSTGKSESLKYLTAKPQQSAIPFSEVLYGIDYVHGAVVLVEGPIDVWAVGPGAVCTLGMGCSPAQFLSLSKLSKGAVCYDSEPLAQSRARQLVADLSSFGGDWSNIVLDAPDPGSAGRDEIKSLRKSVFGEE